LRLKHFKIDGFEQTIIHAGGEACGHSLVRSVSGKAEHAHAWQVLFGFLSTAIAGDIEAAVTPKAQIYERYPRWVRSHLRKRRLAVTRPNCGMVEELDELAHNRAIGLIVVNNQYVHYCRLARKLARLQPYNNIT
jgi:hypothetical protein